MGLNFSSICCTYCSARMPTEEDDFIGITHEVMQKKNRENHPWPFQDYLKRNNSFVESNLMFLENPNIDYFRTDNKLMQRSAIFKVQNIPRIPSPSVEKLRNFKPLHRRSSSCSDLNLNNTTSTKVSAPRNTIQTKRNII
jgi:hypothetical protein